jgi:MerR family transcriptional regulator, light-induced transcriptional regulator
VLSVAMEGQRSEIAEATVTRYFSKHPELLKRYGETGIIKSAEEVEHHLAFLAEAIASSSPSLFTTYVQWARAIRVARKVPVADLAEILKSLREVLSEHLPVQTGAIAGEYLEQALSRFDSFVAEPSHLNGDDPMADLARSYLNALLRGTRQLAATLINSAANGGTDVREIYLRVFQPVLYEIGRLWQNNEISVAQEHYASATTQQVMSQLYPHIFNADRRGKVLVAACVSGDLHEIGLRMVADYFEMAGWDTHYLGANVPMPDLLDLVLERRADMLALSVTMIFDLPAIRDTIEAVRKREKCENLPILVGGNPFNIAPELWRSVGADGYAPDAAIALKVGEDILAIRAAR